MTPDEKDARFYGYQSVAKDALAIAGLERAWEIWKNEHRNDMRMPSDRRKLIDLVGYGASYGYYSTGQIGFIRALLQKIVEK
jgi:hypothetical protein